MERGRKKEGGGEREAEIRRRGKGHSKREKEERHT